MRNSLLTENLKTLFQFSRKAKGWTKTITKPEFNSAMLQRSDLREEGDNNIKRKAKAADSIKDKIETSNIFSALQILSDD